MSGVNPALQTILNNFASSFADGASDPIYQNLVQAINASQSLLDDLNTAASHSSLTGITYNQDGGTKFDAGNIVMNASELAPFLTDLQSAPGSGTYQAGLEGFVDVVGHEVAHANYASSLNDAQQQLLNNSGLSSGSSAIQVDNFLNQYAQQNFTDEGQANIRAWNDVVSENANSATPVGLQDLIARNYFKDVLFVKQSDGTYAPRPGITFSEDGFSIDLSSAQAAGNYVKLMSPSGVDQSNTDYASFYYSGAMEAAGLVTGGSLNVSYLSLGLTINSDGSSRTSLEIGEALASHHYGQQLTIHDADDDTYTTMAPSQENGGTTLMSYVEPVGADGSRSTFLADMGYDGKTYYQISSSTDASGVTSTIAVLSSGLVNLSHAGVTVDSGASGQIVGDADSIKLTDNSGTVLRVSGQSDFISSNGNEIHVLGDGSSVSVNGASNNISLESSNQTLALVSGNNKVKILSNLSAESITGPAASSASVTAGDGDEVTFNGGVQGDFTGGANTKLNVSDASFMQISVGESSAVNIGDNVYAYIGQMSKGTLSLGNGDTFNVTGSGNTITAGDLGASMGASAIFGNQNIFTGKLGTLVIYNGQGNTVTMADGASVSISGASENNTINLSKGSFYASGTDASALGATINGSNNTNSYVYTGIYNLNGDGNAVNLQSASTVLNVRGSSNSLSGTYGTINLLSGDNTTIGTFGCTVDATAVNSAAFTGTSETITATDGVFSISGTSNTFTATGATTLTVSNNYNTINEAAKSTLTVNGGFNTINDSAGSSFSITGESNSVSETLGTSMTITGSDNTVHTGDQSTLHVSGISNKIYASNSIIYVADGSTLSIFGSNDQVIGGPNDSIYVTGTNVAVTASNSWIGFTGNNAGDTVVGPGDTGSNWSAPDPDLPPGNNGGYTPPQTSASLRALSVSARTGTRVDAQEKDLPVAPERASAPDVQALIHALSAFGGSPAGGDGVLVISPSAEAGHMHLAVAA
jgi:hypothetical protein